MSYILSTVMKYIKYMYVYIHIYILYIHIIYLYIYIYRYLYIHTYINDEMCSWIQAALISKARYWPSFKIFQDEVVKIVKSLNMEPLKLTIPRCGMGNSQVENTIPFLGRMQMVQ